MRGFALDTVTEYMVGCVFEIYFGGTYLAHYKRVIVVITKPIEIIKTERKPLLKKFGCVVTMWV